MEQVVCAPKDIIIYLDDIGAFSNNFEHQICIHILDIIIILTNVSGVLQKRLAWIFIDINQAQT